MPWLMSVLTTTVSPAKGSQKLGQPEPESYLCSELNNDVPQQMQR
jgi:hypothetical protein